MPFKSLLSNLFHFFFVHFLARRMAAKLRSHIALLGMTDKQSLVIASPGKSSGMSYLSGFTIPTFRCDVFLPKKGGGWVAHRLTMYVTEQNRLAIETDKKMETISFTDARAYPVVQFLKTILFAWPYTIYMVASETQIADRQPPMRA